MKNMTSNSTDNIAVRRLFQEIEHSIKAINHEKISEIAGEVSKDAFLNTASIVAQLRARYLSKVIELGKSEEISGNDISTLRGLRLMYEEAVGGFGALQHALERGYFSLSDGK